MTQPTYDTVRSEAIDSLAEIAALVPDPKEIVRESEDEPYTCDDEMLLHKASGASFTGQWAIYPPDDFDRTDFIAKLPEHLGSGWEERPLGVDVSFANTYLVQKDTQAQLSVRAIEIKGRKAIDLIAISRCGRLPNDGPLGPRGVRGE